MGLRHSTSPSFDERLEDFQAFHAEFLPALKPKGPVERHLAERAVLCAWRLRRVYRIETGLFCKTRKAWNNGTSTVTDEMEVLFLRLTSRDDVLSKLTRYETSLERSLQRTLRGLERRQAFRGHAIPPGSVVL